MLDRTGAELRTQHVVTLVDAAPGGQPDDHGLDARVALCRRVLSEEHGIPIIGVPKTIDNDLAATDVTFGYQTAVEVATDAIGRLHSTAEAHQRVMVVQVMGRHTGWIALESGLAGGADVILIPELPYSTAAIVDKIKERERSGRRFSIVVVAEGARPAGGAALGAATGPPCAHESSSCRPGGRPASSGSGCQEARRSC